MLKRLITGLVLVGGVLLTLWLGTYSHFALDALIMAFALAGTYEMYRTFKANGYETNPVAPVFLCVAIYPLRYFLGTAGLALAFAGALLLSMTVFTFDPDMRITDFLATVFTLLYPFAFLSLGFSVTRDYPCGGVFGVSFAVFMPVFGDVFAYCAGRAFGKRKLLPSVSPNKTVAGAVGGILGSAVCAVVFYLLFDFSGLIRAGYESFTEKTGVAATVFVLTGILGGIFAEVGDLAASRIKRALGVKDFGTVFPGHGGVLDRLDSIMFTLVLLFAVFEIAY